MRTEENGGLSAELLNLSVNDVLFFDVRGYRVTRSAY